MTNTAKMKIVYMCVHDRNCTLKLFAATMITIVHSGCVDVTMITIVAAITCYSLHSEYVHEQAHVSIHKIHPARH